MSEPSDAELVARLRTGDAVAFDLAYARYHRRIYAFLMRMLLRREIAEDLLQETWIRFARGALDLRDDARLGAWLFRVARNLALSRERRRSIEEDAEAWLTALGFDAPATPLDGAMAADLRRGIELALAALPPRDRELILLVAVDGLEPKEVAEVLALRPEAVRKRLERAREKMHVLLGQVMK